MNRIGLAAIAILLIAAGIAGIVWTVSARTPGSGVPAYVTPSRPPGGTDSLSGSSASLGARIYVDGIGADGAAIPRTVGAGPGMMGGGCVNCHGIDGRGGHFPMMGGFDAPDIRYSTLTAPHEGHDEPAWSDADIRTAIVDGVEPNGEELNAFMPRWELSSAEFRALLGYLRELDNQ